jgi:hypothetical protein
MVAQYITAFSGIIILWALVDIFAWSTVLLSLLSRTSVGIGISEGPIRRSFFCI